MSHDVSKCLIVPQNVSGVLKKESYGSGGVTRNRFICDGNLVICSITKILVKKQGSLFHVQDSLLYPKDPC